MFLIFSLSGPKGYVSYCHHSASVVCCRCYYLITFLWYPQKLIGILELDFAGMMFKFLYKHIFFIYFVMAGVMFVRSSTNFFYFVIWQKNKNPWDLLLWNYRSIWFVTLYKRCATYTNSKYRSHFNLWWPRSVLGHAPV